MSISCRYKQSVKCTNKKIGNEYYVMAHYDNGDYGLFQYGKYQKGYISKERFGWVAYINDCYVGRFCCFKDAKEALYNEILKEQNDGKTNVEAFLENIQ